MDTRIIFGNIVPSEGQFSKNNHAPVTNVTLMQIIDDAMALLPPTERQLFTEVSEANGTLEQKRGSYHVFRIKRKNALLTIRLTKDGVTAEPKNVAAKIIEYVNEKLKSG